MVCMKTENGTRPKITRHKNVELNLLIYDMFKEPTTCLSYCKNITQQNVKSKEYNNKNLSLGVEFHNSLFSG